MAIEIASKSKFKNLFSLKSLFFLFLILFFAATILGYFILGYLENDALTKIEKLNVEINLTKSSEIILLENEVKTAKKKIDDFSRLVSGHKTPSKFLNFSEGSFAETKNFGKLIHPKVQILDISIDAENLKVDISGLTENFTTLEQQYLIFQQEPLIKEVNLSGMSLGKEGGINFSFDLLFESGIFTQ